MAKVSKAAAKYGPVGQEDVNMNTLRPGFIRLIQKTSAKQGFNLGDLVDGDTGEVLGKEIVVIPVKKYIDWVKFTDDFKLDDRSIDGQTWVNSKRPLSPDEKWQDMRVNFLVYIQGRTGDMPQILTFGKTSMKYGQKMETTIAKNITINKEPIFGRMWRIYTDIETNKKKQEYAVIKAELLPGEPDDDMLEKANKAAGTFTKMLAENKAKLLEMGTGQAAPAAAPAVKKSRKY